MISQFGLFKSFVNVGEFGDDLEGKIMLKQWYLVVKCMKNMELIFQSGFQLMFGIVLVVLVNLDKVKYGVLKVLLKFFYMLIFFIGYVDIFCFDWVKVVSLFVFVIMVVLLLYIKFYGEVNMFGVFYEDLEIVCLFCNEVDDIQWIVDFWFYDKLLEVDLGGIYQKDLDIWEFGICWLDSVIMIILEVDVDGEFINGIEIINLFGGWLSLVIILQIQLCDLLSLLDGVIVIDQGMIG